jgi:hypothetical protein
MLHHSEEWHGGVGSALLEQAADAIDERSEVVTHRHA